MSTSEIHASPRFRVIAIIAAFNEGDVIYHVIRDLIENDVEVYFIDNCSTDNTVAEASRMLGKGLLNIERFPDEAAGPARATREYAWGDLLQRKEELASELDAEWFIHADADEFRESLWPNLRLAEAMRLVDQLGYNAIQFQVLNFRPVNDSFMPGDDVRKYLTAYESPGSFDELQIKAWKKCGPRINLVRSGGHEVSFPNRRVFPFRFPMRHYPIRSSQLGKKKVFNDRLPRFMPEEKAIGWHVQYNKFQNGGKFLWQVQELREYDALQVRADIMARTHAQLDSAQLPPENSYTSAPVFATPPDKADAEELCRQINDDAGFQRLYNLASALEESGQRDPAAKIFETILLLLHKLNPELAGKAGYKLALLSEDLDRRTEHLQSCLTLLPSHKAARAMLTELRGCRDDSV